MELNDAEKKLKELIVRIEKQYPGFFDFNIKKEGLSLLGSSTTTRRGLTLTLTPKKNVAEIHLDIEDGKITAGSANSFLAGMVSGFKK